MVLNLVLPRVVVFIAFPTALRALGRGRFAGRDATSETTMSLMGLLVYRDLVANRRPRSTFCPKYKDPPCSGGPTLGTSSSTCQHLRIPRKACDA